MVTKADKHLIKALNESRILKLVRRSGAISRAELARESQLSKVAVYDIIRRLIEAGLVSETEKVDSTNRGGKKPTLIKLDIGRCFVIGIEFRRRNTQIALANITAQIVETASVTYNDSAAIEDVMPLIFAQTDSLLTAHKIQPAQLQSIGIGIPGLINYETGQLRFAHTLGGWGNKPIAQLFEERYSVETILENDVKLRTLGESLYGAGKNRSSMVCVWIGAGIGSGIIHNFQLMRGVHGSAGEIGYLELNDFSPPLKHLYQGQKFFGDVLSEQYLYDTLLTQLRKSGSTELNSDSTPDFPTLIRIADQQDSPVKEILEEYAYLLFIVCYNYIKK